MDPDGIYRDIDTDDVLVEILLRLHPNTRRRLRLVCRHWRDVVGTPLANPYRAGGLRLPVAALADALREGGPELEVTLP